MPCECPVHRGMQGIFGKPLKRALRDVWVEGGGGFQNHIFEKPPLRLTVWGFFRLFWSGCKHSRSPPPSTPITRCAWGGGSTGPPTLFWGWGVQKICFGEGWDGGRAVQGQKYEQMGYNITIDMALPGVLKIATLPLKIAPPYPLAPPYHARWKHSPKCTTLARFECPREIWVMWAPWMVHAHADSDDEDVVGDDRDLCVVCCSCYLLHLVHLSHMDKPTLDCALCCTKSNLGLSICDKCGLMYGMDCIDMHTCDN